LYCPCTGRPERCTRCRVQHAEYAFTCCFTCMHAPHARTWLAPVSQLSALKWNARVCTRSAARLKAPNDALPASGESSWSGVWAVCVDRTLVRCVRGTPPPPVGGGRGRCNQRQATTTRSTSSSSASAAQPQPHLVGTAPAVLPGAARCLPRKCHGCRAWRQTGSCLRVLCNARGVVCVCVWGGGGAAAWWSQWLQEGTGVTCAANARSS
jgi:hypothetical protein